MAVLRTRRLVAIAQAVAGTVEVIYTVPSGYRSVVRDVRVSNRTGNTSTRTLVMLRTSGVSDCAIIDDASLPTETLLALTCDCVLEAGDSIVVFNTIAGVVYYVSGAELTLPP